MNQDEYLRYLGVLGLLEVCSPYVDEETRESIERAFAGACAAHPTLTWRRMLDRVEITSFSIDRADKQDRAAGSVSRASRGKAVRPGVRRTVTRQHAIAKAQGRR